MKKGIGIDIVKINRFREKKYDSNETFYKKNLPNMKWNIVYSLKWFYSRGVQIKIHIIIFQENLLQRKQF